MATSKSPDWASEALVFSGRPNPTWGVPEPAARRLLSEWDGLATRPPTRSAAPALGYRGCVLRGAGGREWRAFGGAVDLVGPDEVEGRADPGRAWERALLSTAPAGALPPIEL
ncbi:MAG: hypothetical protein ACR2HV_05575 [Acidimicrobiales bacterium]